MTSTIPKAGRMLLACFLLCILVQNAAWAQHRRDPLNPLEVDELRETALDADKRLKLYVKFARERLEALVQMRADPKATDRARQTRARLQEFLDVYDELNENIDNFADRKDDLRKPLKAVIEADTEFQAKLRALKASAEVNNSEVEQYHVLLANALDTLDSSTQDHRALLSEQEKAPPRKKN
jgi:hypothetical protein